MAGVKIEIRLGEIEFKGEGDKEWIGEQLDKLLEKSSDLVKLSALRPPGPPPLELSDAKTNASKINYPDIARKTLTTFLQENKAQTNQVKKLLASAIWLHAKGKARLKTKDITVALKETMQKPLVNPSATVNQNRKKGHIEKDENNYFWVTEDGANSLLNHIYT